MSDTSSCLRSDSNYYPTVSEHKGAENVDLRVFLSKAKKATFECLPRETLSHFSQFLKQNNTLLCIITEKNNTLQRANRSILSLRKPICSPSPDVVPDPPSLIDAVSKILEPRDYDKAAEETIVLYNVP